MPKIVGEKPENLSAAHGYMKTGFYSLDKAFNPYGDEIGIPFGTLWEIYGASHTAKSTTAYCLASMLASHLNTGWILCDVEGAFTPEYILDIGSRSGMADDSIIQIAKGTFHDDKLTDIFKQMMKGGIGVGIVDSLGMLASRAEIEGELGEANMGKRAFMINQWVRKYFSFKNDQHTIPSHATIFMINHQQESLGGYGMNRPGGTGKDYGAGVRIHLKRATLFKDNSFQLVGTIKKLRWMGGGLNNTFQFVSKTNYGMHRGLSTILDLKDMKVVTISRGVIKVKSGSLKGESLGRFSQFLKEYEDDDKFQVIYDILDEHRSMEKPDEEDLSEEE